MLQSLISRSASLLPQAAIGHLGWLRGALGAGLAILCAGAITAFLMGGIDPSLPWLIAPVGASAVLVFSVPASPLAQPWPVVGGNLVSGLVGLLLGKFLGLPLIAAALAVAGAIALMSLTRSLHPPGGACALLYALGAAGPDAWGWMHLLAIACNLVLLALGGWLFNNLTGHPWPHRTILPAKPTLPPTLAYTHEDLEAVLADWNEVLDVDPDDLDALFQALGRRIAAKQGMSTRR